MSKKSLLIIGLLQLLLGGCSEEPSKPKFDFKEFENRLLVGDTKTRIEAAKQLAENRELPPKFFQTNHALLLLLKACQDQDPQIRTHIATALGNTQATSTIKTLMRFTEDRDIQVRISALKALGKTNRQETLGTIVSALSDQNSKVRAEAVRSLAIYSNNKKVLFKIKKALSDPVPRVRIAAAQVLGQVGDPSLIKLLEKYANRKNPQVAEAAREAIKQINLRHPSTPKPSANDK